MSLAITLVTLALTFAGHRYANAELPHIVASLTLTLPLGVLGYMLRSTKPSMLGFVIVAVIQWTL